ncbi:MAG: hypothetical protein H8F28_22415 [Fibrella sp.]|nr:hypothetical protein [Armatimonadota bacterium]
MNHDQTTLLQPFVAAAQGILARTLGGPVRLGDAEILRDFGYPKVLRCKIQEAPSDVGTKIVIKRCGVRNDGTYDPAYKNHALLSEWAGARFLQDLDAAPPLGPRCLGGDQGSGIVLVEDLGDGKSLADVLQGDDRVSLENGLLQYSASLGRLHAATAGRAAELEAAWSSLGTRWEASETPYRQAESWAHENATPFREGCESLQVAVATGFAEEARAVWEAMARPGPFLAFTPGDTCPDNHRLTADGYVRFFDFEACGFRHALLDAAYCHAPFPTCWCVQRLPIPLAPRMTDAYRGELIQGCPEAGDDDIFYTALAHACASWAVSVASWHLTEAMENDRPTGLVSLRQRVVLNLDSFVETADRLGKLPALRDTANALATKLRSLWGDDAKTLYYPALR